MPPCRGKSYLISAREDLSGWIEARALSRATSELVAQFLWEDVICRHGCFGKLVCDGGPENKKYVEALALRYGINRVVASAYNPTANGVSERGHQPVINGLAKMDGGDRKWVENLPAILWADRTTVRAPTGKTPYEILYGYRCVLPIETRIPSWSTLPWTSVRSREDLLAMRAQQMQRRDEDLEEAAARLQRMREQGKEAWDQAMDAKESAFQIDDLVLLYNSRYQNDDSIVRKLAFWWLGPYRVVYADNRKGTYTPLNSYSSKLLAQALSNKKST